MALHATPDNRRLPGVAPGCSWTYLTGNQGDRWRPSQGAILLLVIAGLPGTAVQPRWEGWLIETRTTNLL